MKYIITLILIFTIKLSAYPQFINLSPNTKFYAMCISGLMIREKPTSKSKTIGKLEYNTCISINQKTEIYETFEGINNAWVEISYNNKTGYIFGGYLSRFKGPIYGSKSLKKYIDSCFVKQGNFYKKEIGQGDAQEKQVIQEYEQGVKYIEYAGYESQGVKIIIPSITFQEAFLIAKNIDTKFSKLRFSIGKDNIIQECYDPDIKNLCVDFGDCFYIETNEEGNVVLVIYGGC